MKNKHPHAGIATLAAEPPEAVTSTACRELELVLAEYDRDQLPPPARQHLAECPACAAMVEDFARIADRVRSLPALDPEPVPNQWPQIRDVLLREGIIHAGGECSAAPPTAKVPSPRLVPPPES